MTIGALAGRLIGVCGCPEDELCAMCLDNRFMQLKGVAARRGELWGAQMTVQWPEETMRALAETRVADLTRDARLREKLAAEAMEWAKRARASDVRGHSEARR